jgi:hypothetical protein
MNTVIVSGSAFYYDKIPDLCPICHSHIDPKYISAVLCGKNEHEYKSLQLVFQCTKSSCNNIFISTYFGGFDSYEYSKSEPIKPEKISFNEAIQTLSPDFINIYNQAIAAESLGLTEIIGIGLRKSLEFLIKDYLISKHPEHEDKIKKSLLGKCIQDYIDEPNIKVCAERATWLGNDETHYVRKWDDKDIEDLRKLINLTVYWIGYIYETEKYHKEMPAKK